MFEYNVSQNKMTQHLRVRAYQTQMTLIRPDSHQDAIKVTLLKALSIMFLGDHWPKDKLRLWYGLLDFPTIQSYEGLLLVIRV